MQIKSKSYQHNDLAIAFIEEKKNMLLPENNNQQFADNLRQ